MPSASVSGPGLVGSLSASSSSRGRMDSVEPRFRTERAEAWLAVSASLARSTCRLSIWSSSSSRRFNQSGMVSTRVLIESVDILWATRSGLLSIRLARGPRLTRKGGTWIGWLCPLARAGVPRNNPCKHRCFPVQRCRKTDWAPRSTKVLLRHNSSLVTCVNAGKHTWVLAVAMISKVYIV